MTCEKREGTAVRDVEERDLRQRQISSPSANRARCPVVADPPIQRPQQRRDLTWRQRSSCLVWMRKINREPRASTPRGSPVHFSHPQRAPRAHRQPRERRHHMEADLPGRSCGRTTPTRGPIYRAQNESGRQMTQSDLSHQRDNVLSHQRDNSRVSCPTSGTTVRVPPAGHSIDHLFLPQSRLSEGRGTW